MVSHTPAASTVVSGASVVGASVLGASVTGTSVAATDVSGAGPVVASAADVPSVAVLVSSLHAATVPTSTPTARITRHLVMRAA